MGWCVSIREYSRNGSLQHRRNSWRKYWHVEGGLRAPSSGISGLVEYLFAFVDTYYLVQVHRMAYTRSGMTSAPYREYTVPLSAVVALVAMYVYDSSATGRFPRALLYEEVSYTLHGVSAS